MKYEIPQMLMIGGGTIVNTASTLGLVVIERAVGRLGKPEEIAEGLLWPLSDSASFVTGHTLTINGGWTVR